MLHLILGILKVIGIILLTLLGLLLLAILALLFVPVRYRLAGKKETELLEGSAGVSWLLHLIGITADYKEKQLTVRLKLFGIPIRRFGGGKEKNKKQKNPRGKNSPKNKAVPTAEATGDSYYTGKEISTKIPDTQDYQKSIIETSDEQKRKQKRILDLFSEVQEIPDKLERHKNNIKEKIEPFLQDDARNLLSRIISRLKYLWKHYRPRKIKGWLRFGTGAPDITGELTGLIYLLLPSSSDQMDVIPDFTEKVLETDIALKGHVRACYMVKVAFLMWRDKEFRNILRRVRED